MNQTPSGAKGKPCMFVTVLLDEIMLACACVVLFVLCGYIDMILHDHTGQYSNEYKKFGSIHTITYIPSSTQAALRKSKTRRSYVWRRGSQPSSMPSLTGGQCTNHHCPRLRTLMARRTCRAT